MMKLTILGQNGPFPAAGGACSGYLVASDRTLLGMDMGTGVLAALTRLTAPEQLSALFLTHWHGDHCSDVLPLIYRMEAAVAGGAAPLPVYAPVDNSSPVRQAVLATKAMVLHDIAPGETVTAGNITITVFPARHPVPAVMLRLSDGEKTLCFTGDTNTQDALDSFARDADLLLADGLFPTAAWTETKPHLSARLCAELAVRSGAKRLIITHLNPTIDPEQLLREARAVYPAAVLAERGMTCQL